MKKLLYALALTIGAAYGANAAPGDSTWVQATNRRFDRGNGYGAYDTAVTFPSGAVSYRKIYMVFTLGKYACPGYDPNRPGEGAGQTGWCGDWDYTVMNYLTTPTDTIELGRFITPYANSNWPRTPLSWTQNYVYDVTDYYPLLKGSAGFRVFYSGYSAGFTGDVKFLFIEGTPEREVLRIDRLWDGGYDYGRTTSINTALKSFSNTTPAGTQSSVVKLNVTGHGGDSRACAEFCPNTFNLSLNGNGSFVTQQLFRDNCSENDLYPQSGTWIYARANWCPGAVVNTFSYPMTGVTGGSTYQLGMTFPAFTTTGGNPASYIISGVVMNYGATRKALDAAIEDIIAPTDNANHFRSNPTSTRPIITVRNSGSTAITSIQIEYGVEGRLPNTYTWTGNLASFESRDITLPPLGQLQLNAGTYGFYARVVLANGQADADALNDRLSSRFTAAPVWPADISVQLTTNSAGRSNGSSETSWKILDAAGNVVAQKLDCGIRTVCENKVHLNDGAYTLVVSDSVKSNYFDIPSNGAAPYITGTGLTGSYTTDGYSGSLRIYDTSTGLPIQLRGYFSGNFGAGFKQSFYVGSPLSIGKTANIASVSLSATPNPATNSFVVKVDGSGSREGTIRVVDVTGREVLRQAYRYGFEQISSENLRSGIYQISYEGKDGSFARQRIVIAH